MNRSISNYAWNSIQHKLNLEPAPASLSDLANLADRVEDIAIESITMALKSCSHMLFNQNKALLREQKIEFAISRSIITRRQLDIAIVLLPGNDNINMNLATIVHDLDIPKDIGTVDKMSVIYPEVIRINFRNILILVEKIYRLAYGWLYTQINSLVSNESLVATELYRYTRNYIGENTAINSLFFVAIIDDQGIYLFDGASMHSAAKKLRNNGSGGQSGSALGDYFRLTANIIEYEVMNSKNAFESNKSINVRFLESKYLKDKKDYLNTELVMFGSNEHVVVPIANKDKYKLIAAFPLKDESSLIIFLENHKYELAKQFEIILESSHSVFSLRTKLNEWLSHLSNSVEFKLEIFGFKIDLIKLFRLTK